MKKLTIAVAIAGLAISSAAFAGKHSGTYTPKVSKETKEATGTSATAEHEHVNGYTKKDGTVVQGYDRSMKDDTKANNWSTKGNTNPETGKAGTK